MIVGPVAAATVPTDYASTNSTERTTTDTALQGSDADTFELAPEEVGDDTVTVSLSTTVTEAAGYQANVTFDPEIVQVASVNGTDFGDPVTNVDNENGWVFLTQSRPSGQESPTFATIVFEFVGDGTTTVTFVEGDSSVNDENGERVELSYAGTEIDSSDSSDDSDDSDDSDGSNESTETDGNDGESNDSNTESDDADESTANSDEDESNDDDDTGAEQGSDADGDDVADDQDTNASTDTGSDTNPPPNTGEETDSGTGSSDSGPDTTSESLTGFTFGGSLLVAVILGLLVRRRFY